MAPRGGHFGGDRPPPAPGRGGAARPPAPRSAGYYPPGAGPGGAYIGGATATSLPVIAGTVLVSELQAGHIDHALALALPFPEPANSPGRRSAATAPAGPARF